MSDAGRGNIIHPQHPVKCKIMAASIFRVIGLFYVEPGREYFQIHYKFTESEKIGKVRKYFHRESVEHVDRITDRKSVELCSQIVKGIQGEQLKRPTDSLLPDFLTDGMYLNMNIYLLALRDETHGTPLLSSYMMNTTL
jgi:hypothetical protein